MVERAFQIHRIRLGGAGFFFAFLIDRDWTKGSNAPPSYQRRPVFYGDGAFFKRMETIRKHLRALKKYGVSLDKLSVESYTVSPESKTVITAYQALGLKPKE